MKIEFGFCSVCGKAIAKTCEDCGSKKITNDYTEVQVTWSNDSKMNIAVCVACATNNAWTTPEAKKAITEAHFDYWTSQGGTFDRSIVIV